MLEEYYSHYRSSEQIKEKACNGSINNQPIQVYLSSAKIAAPNVSELPVVTNSVQYSSR